MRSLQKEVLGEAASLSFRGIGDQPTKEGRKHFFEIGNKLFAAVPSKTLKMAISMLSSKLYSLEDCRI